MKISHIRRWLIAIVVLCILSVQALPRKKSLKKNLSAEQSDLIPIPDHLLDDYKISGKHKIFMTFINILKTCIRVKTSKTDMKPTLCCYNFQILLTFELRNMLLKS